MPRAWLAQLSASADSSQGLIVAPEPIDAPGGHGQATEHHITPLARNRHTATDLEDSDRVATTAPDDDDFSD